MSNAMECGVRKLMFTKHRTPNTETRTPLWLRLDARLTMVSVAMLILLGCGPANRGSVVGVVSVEGEPVESGTIRFTRVDREGPSFGTKIENGNYEIRAAEGPTVGTYYVTISGRRATGKMIPVDGTENLTYPETVRVVPESYETGNQLEREIKAGKNELDFDLEKNPQKKPRGSR